MTLTLSRVPLGDLVRCAPLCSPAFPFGSTPPTTGLLPLGTADTGDCIVLSCGASQALRGLSSTPGPPPCEGHPSVTTTDTPPMWLRPRGGATAPLERHALLGFPRESYKAFPRAPASLCASGRPGPGQTARGRTPSGGQFPKEAEGPRDSGLLV